MDSEESERGGTARVYDVVGDSIEVGDWIEVDSIEVDSIKDVAMDSLVGGVDESESPSRLETTVVVGAVSSILENKPDSVKSSGTSLPACSCKSFSSSSSSRSLCSCLSLSSLSFFSLSRLSFARRSSSSCSLFPVLSLSLATALNCFCSHLNASIWFMPYTLRDDTGQ